MSILEQAKQSVEYDARVPLEVAQALLDLHKVAQAVVAEYSEEKCAFCGAWIEDSHANKLPHRKHCAFAALAAKLEEVR